MHHGSLNWSDICEGQVGNEDQKPLKICRCNEPVIPLPIISLIKKLPRVHLDAYGKMFTEALFVIAKLMEDKFISKGMLR